jgi:hypothetical protein
LLSLSEVRGGDVRRNIRWVEVQEIEKIESVQAKLKLRILAQNRKPRQAENLFLVEIQSISATNHQFLRQRFRVPSKAQLRAKVPFLRGPPIAPRLRVMPVK